MSEPWSERAELYRTSSSHAVGPDLDLIVEWAEGCANAVDVATGGGHVARRLREAGLEVVSCDPAPGMEPDVICFAEELPFADRSVDLTVTRVAAHHFEDVARATRELERVASKRVVVVDSLYMGEDSEEAEKLRDPSHVRNYSEAEWRALFTGAGLEVEDVRIFVNPIDLDAWLERTGCTGEAADRACELFSPRIADGPAGTRLLTLDRIALRGRVG